MVKNTRKYTRTVLGALVLLGVAGIWQRGEAQDKPARTLKVKVHYSGAGVVDAKHKIYLFAFDSPDFMTRQDVMPIGGATATDKDETVTFSNVAKSPVFLIAAYDPTGVYEGMSPPPSGSSVALYGKTPGQVDPVKIDEGKTVEIDLAFDDTIKMP